MSNVNIDKALQFIIGIMVLIIVGLTVVSSFAPTLINASTDIGNSGLPFAGVLGGDNSLVLLLAMVSVLILFIAAFVFKMKKGK